MEEAESREFPDEGEGVKEEVEAWANGIVDGGKSRRQSPEEALADLELVSLGVLDSRNTTCSTANALMLVGSHVEKWREGGKSRCGCSCRKPAAELVLRKDIHTGSDRLSTRASVQDPNDVQTVSMVQALCYSNFEG